MCLDQRRSDHSSDSKEHRQRPCHQQGDAFNPQRKRWRFIVVAPVSHLKLWPRQYLSHFAAIFIEIMAQNRSPPFGDTHHAAV